MKYKEYIIYSAKAQLKAELARSRIGWIWWILEPTMYMFIYFFVFTVIFQRQTEYVGAMINIGLQYWTFFSHCLLASTGLIRKNYSVLSKVYIPKYILVLSTMLVNLFKMMFAALPVALILCWYHVHLTWAALQVIPVTLIFFLVVFAVCCIVMHIGVYFQDVERIVPIIVRMLFFLSGVFYPIDEKLGEKLAEYMLRLNPFGAVITDVRGALLYGTSCHWTQIGTHALVFLLLAVIGVMLVQKKESQYIKVV